MNHAINWFEIPVTDFTRAKKFYETILNADMQFMEAMGMKSAFFPADLKVAPLAAVSSKGMGMSHQPKARECI